MEKYTGKSIFKGIAIGKILFYQKGEQPVKRVKIEDTAEQIKRYEDARAKAAEQLQGLYEKALKEVGEANAAVFEVHQMMLEDDDYIDSVVNIIETQQVNAEFAVATTGDNFAKMFAEMEDDYFKARAADVKDISERMVNILSGNESGGALGDEPVIVVAEDLAPSETVQMDKEKLLAFVTRLGSANSHTAILARTMNIPALIEVDIKEEWNGKMAVVDGYTGTFYIDPDEETLKKMQEKKEEDIKARELLQELKGKEDITVDGKHIKLYANIGGVKDVTSVLANDAAGIGLFRSEFLYLEADNYDGVVLDIMMPKVDGLTVLRKVRERGNLIPILLLTAKSEVDDKVEGLDAGANDYLAKPFHSKELLARIRAITRAQTAQANSKLKMGNVTLDRAAFELSTSKGSFRLANKEFQMLELLMCNPHQLISSERFLEKIWGYDSEAEINVVWVYISYLRKKLSALHADIQIKATRNAGYSLEERS